MGENRLLPQTVIIVKTTLLIWNLNNSNCRDFKLKMFPNMHVRLFQLRDLKLKRFYCPWKSATIIGLFKFIKTLFDVINFLFIVINFLNPSYKFMKFLFKTLF